MRRGMDNRDKSATYTAAIRSHKCSNCGAIYGCECQVQHKRRHPKYDCGNCEKVPNNARVGITNEQFVRSLPGRINR